MNESSQPAVLRRTPVSSTISWCSPQASGIPGAPRKSTPTHLLRAGARRVPYPKALAASPHKDINTPRGWIRVSTPEATTVDLVGYCRRVGGLGQVATVLHELAERIDPQRLVAAARSAPIPWAQRLGYLLELFGAYDQVKTRARQTVPLLPGFGDKKSQRDANWKVFVNTEIEAEL